MKTSLLLLAALCLGGCAKQPSKTNVAIPPEPHAVNKPHDYIAEFRAYAKEHDLYYQIRCESWRVDEEVYLAELCIAKCDLIYEEEGGKGMWLAEGSTQEDAARDALRETDEHPEPNYFFHKHSPSYKEATRQCKRPIKGGPGMEERP
jgi:hypothetical protein